MQKKTVCTVRIFILFCEQVVSHIRPRNFHKLATQNGGHNNKLFSLERTKITEVHGRD